MQQPINGRLLVKVAVSEYKHVTLDSDKQHHLATSNGVVLAVAPDLEHIINTAMKIEQNGWPKNLPRPTELVGKTIWWDKFAEQNTLHEVEDPKNKDKKIKVALIEYKDITSYEG